MTSKSNIGRESVMATLMHSLTRKWMATTVTYDIGQKVEYLPCGGYDHCSRAHESWKRFTEDVNNVVLLAVRTVGVFKEEAIADLPRSENET